MLHATTFKDHYASPYLLKSSSWLIQCHVALGHLILDLILVDPPGVFKRLLDPKARAPNSRFMCVARQLQRCAVLGLVGKRIA